MQQKSKRFCMFLHLYVFYVCATFHCIWRSRFKVICTLVSALKSKMAAISMETKRGEKKHFLHIFYTDHNKCKMKWVDWKMSKTVFRPAPPLNRSKKWVIHTRPGDLGSKTAKQLYNSSCTKSALPILRTASIWTRPTRHWCHTQFRSILYESWDNKIVLE